MPVHFLLSTVLILGLPFFAAAETTGADGKAVSLFDLSIEELQTIIISSASKRPETSAQAPAGVVVITRQDIEIYGYQTLEELMQHIPGFYQVDTYEDLLIGVRGILGASMQVLVDGVPRHPVRIKGMAVPERERFNIPIESIDRIEIVRGPMSVIYGNNAFLGSINIVTRQPESEQSLISVGLGSKGSGQATWRLMHNFAEDGFVSMNGGIISSDGIGGQLDKPMSDAQLSRLNPQMHDRLDGDLSLHNYSLNLSAGYRGLRASLRYSDMHYGIYLATPSFNKGNRLHLTTFYASLGYTGELLEGLTLHTQLVSSHEVYDLATDFLLPDIVGNQMQESRRAEAEVVLSYLPWQWTEILIGYNYQRIFDVSNRAKVPNLIAFSYSTPTPADHHDFFLDAHQFLFDDLWLTAGFRISLLSSYTHERMDSPGDSDQQTHSTYRFNDGWEPRYVPRAALIYNIGKHHTLKALYGEALQDNNEVEFEEAERIRTAELLYLTQYPRWSLQASVFYNSTDNLLRKVQQVDPVTGTHEKRIDNSGALQTWGFELFARAEPIDNLFVCLSTTLQQTADQNNPDIAVGNSPTALAKARLAYRFTIAEYGTLTLGLLGSYVSAMKTDWQWLNELDQWERIGQEVDPYFLLGANLRYLYPKHGFYAVLHGSNIFNKDVRYPANELVQFDGGAFGQRLRVSLLLGINFQ